MGLRFRPGEIDRLQGLLPGDQIWSPLPGASRGRAKRNGRGIHPVCALPRPGSKGTRDPAPLVPTGLFSKKNTFEFFTGMFEPDTMLYV
jgi:hypothetical protein